MNTIKRQDVEDKKLISVIASLRLSGLSLDEEQCTHLQKYTDRPMILNTYKRISDNANCCKLLVVSEDVEQTCWVLSRIAEQVQPYLRVFEDDNNNTWDVVSVQDDVIVRTTLLNRQWSGVVFDTNSWPDYLLLSLSRLKCFPLHKFQVMVLRDVMRETFLDSIRVESV